jgi:hypothetical protein
MGLDLPMFLRPNLQVYCRVHCPNIVPYFTLYRMYTTVAFLYREKNSAQLFMLAG